MKLKDINKEEFELLCAFFVDPFTQIVNHSGSMHTSVHLAIHPDYQSSLVDLVVKHRVLYHNKYPIETVENKSTYDLTEPESNQRFYSDEFKLTDIGNQLVSELGTAVRHYTIKELTDICNKVLIGN